MFSSESSSQFFPLERHQSRGLRVNRLVGKPNLELECLLQIFFVVQGFNANVFIVYGEYLLTNPWNNIGLFKVDEEVYLTQKSFNLNNRAFTWPIGSVFTWLV